MSVDMRDALTLRPLRSAPAHRLGEWSATAICGNDITSSSLYVVALAAIYAGTYAPVRLLLGAFNPGLIERLSREWGIPKNYMFIGSPSGRFPYKIAELGGVRLII